MACISCGLSRADWALLSKTQWPGPELEARSTPGQADPAFARSTHGRRGKASVTVTSPSPSPETSINYYYHPIAVRGFRDAAQEWVGSAVVACRHESGEVLPGKIDQIALKDDDFRKISLKSFSSVKYYQKLRTLPQISIPSRLR